MNNIQTVHLTAQHCVLRWDAIVGESPLWHMDQRRLYWVDIQSQKIHRFDPVGLRNETFNLPQIVTCLAFCERGGLLLTLAKNLAYFDPDTDKLKMLVEIEKDLPGNRFNDGRCDRQGRFWAGTMGTKNWKAAVGALYRVDADLSVTQMQSQVACSNGTDWSPDGRTMYYTESFGYAIFAYDFDCTTGDLTNRRIFASMDQHSDIFPDGLTVDAQGFVWSNHVGAGQVVRYDPDGRIDRIIQLPVPRATGCTFGGPDLDTLYITTARETMTPEQLKQSPLSGSLFAVRMDVRGLAATSFKSTTGS